MPQQPEARFIRYLAAKKSVDDRALNRHVWEAMAAAVRSRERQAPLRVLEVGCGSGTMLERLLDGGVLTRGAYLGIDLEPANLAAARERLGAFAAARSAVFREEWGTLRWLGPQQDLAVDFRAADLFEFAGSEERRRSWDLLVAHALLDLVDLATALPLLFSLLDRGGLFYFTLNFDGATILQPPLDPDLDRRIEELYHQTMDQRRRHGQPAGSSRTGRRLFGQLQAAGATLLAAGASDWVVAPLAGDYPQDEAYFLHFLIDTIHRALAGHPQLEDQAFQNWIEARHRQIEQRELIYIAHQLDFLGYI